MATPSRKHFVCGNWKMNGDKFSIDKIITILNTSTLDPQTEVVVAPSFVYIEHVYNNIRPQICVAGQNCYKMASGAFTGDVSPGMLKDVGASWVILGHSERRHLFGESDQLIGEKAALALGEGLKLILCVGEKDDEREAGRTLEVIFGQLHAMLENISDWENVVIVYEPVWVFGTGKTDTPEQVQAIHAKIRLWLIDNVSTNLASITRIIYGGVVTEANCEDFAKKPDIDGFLVSEASLKPEFVKIINAKRDLRFQ